MSNSKSKAKNFFQNLIKPFKFSSGREGQSEENLDKIAAQEQKQFAFDTLVSATKNFHPTHKLGQGGFGPVYRGKLDDGREIAVKRLSRTSNQGKKEFTNEAKLLARVQHRNVVNLLGYCAHGTEKLLVYEYISNESLDKLLFSAFLPQSTVPTFWLSALIFLCRISLMRPHEIGHPDYFHAESNKREQLDWKRRYDIITGIARGLLYLHEDSHDCIIHRDIKASNILLDDKWVPKIADFGMARLFPEDQTHVNTRVAGTNGYMAPEYVMHAHLSVKADVFSFGVLVLELISSQRNATFKQSVEAQNLLEWAYKLHKKDRSLELMDPTLASSADPDQVKMCIHIGLLCTQSDPQLRPNMRRVVVLLSKKPGNLEEPMRPGVPGSRYRRSRRPPGMSSTAGTSIDSNSQTSDSTSNTNTATASTTTHTDATLDPNAATASTSTPSDRRRFDPHGKKPMEG